MFKCRSHPFLSSNADKKEMEETICQKNITFMSMDKRLKSASRYTKSTGGKENMKDGLVRKVGLKKEVQHGKKELH